MSRNRKTQNERKRRRDREALEPAATPPEPKQQERAPWSAPVEEEQSIAEAEAETIPVSDAPIHIVEGTGAAGPHKG